MSSARQRSAARSNIRKAAAAARSQRTIARLPQRVRSARGRKAASVARRKRRGAQH